MLNASTALVFVLGCWISLADSHCPMGEESFGNDELPAGNYATWPGLVDAINDENRVYQQWVNGSEFCCYRGDMPAINRLLEKYSRVTCERLELVLLPGPGATDSFEGRTIEFDLKISFNGGIASQMASRDRAANLWKTWPVVTIYLNDGIDLARLQVPDNVTVLELEDLKRDCLQGLESTDKTVRGWTCGILAALNPYDVESMETIAELLEDDDTWIRANAVSALSQFGEKVANRTSVLGLIEANSDSSDDQLRQYVARTLEALDVAEADPEKERDFHRQLTEIQQFCSDRE